MDRMMQNMLNVHGTLFPQQSMMMVPARSTSDDMKEIQEILAAHSPDVNFNVNEQALLNIAQDILNKANTTFPPLVSTLKFLLYSLGRGKAPLLDITVYAGSTFMGISLAILAGNFSSYPYYIVLTGLCICMVFFLVKTMKRVLFAEDKKTDPTVLDERITDELVYTIHKIGCELSCNYPGGGDLKLITVAVFDTLVKYSWEDKLVIALLAFAVNYGDSCLPRQVDATNPLAKYLVQFKSLPDISGQKALTSHLMKVVIDTAKSIIKLNELHSLYSQYILQGKPPLSQAKISDDVYWAIKGIVACSFQSTGLVNVGNRSWGKITDTCIIDLIHILESRHRNLTDILDQCNKLIRYRVVKQDYDNLKEFMTEPHTIVEVLITLIDTKDNKPLFHRESNEKVSLNVLQRKKVILFFSYFDIPIEEIKEIEQQIWKTDHRQYEIVWLPVLYKEEISDEMKEVIHQKARLMPWYSVHYSLTLHTCVIKYIKKKWKFEKKPLLVAFNEEENAKDSRNVYDMIMTWGTSVCPFDAQIEEQLWMTIQWGHEIFIDKKPEHRGKLIYLYGGDDLGWIRNFISLIKEVVKADEIELIYVGKKHRETIKNERLSDWWGDLKIMWFWARMHSILYSKMKFGGSIDNDKIFKDVLMLLGYEGSGTGWAIIGYGSNNMVALNGETIMQWLVQLKKLEKVPMTIQIFLKKLVEFKAPTRKTHCNHIYVTGTGGIIQEKMVCVDCNCPMEKKVMFTCCKNE